MNFFLDFQISVSRLNLYFLFKKLFRCLLNFKKTRAWCFARGEREIAIEFQTCRFLVLCGSRCAPVCVCVGALSRWRQGCSNRTKWSKLRVRQNLPSWEKRNVQNMTTRKKLSCFLLVKFDFWTLRRRRAFTENVNLVFLRNSYSIIANLTC